MNVLAFDCTGRVCSAAVRSGGRLVAHRRLVLERGQAEVLMPMVVAVLAEAGLDWPAVAVIGVTVGPGTFTGVRLGLAAARGMALAGGMRLVGITTMEAGAHAVPAEARRGRTLLVAVDGKRADLFAQAFAEDLTPLTEPRAVMPDAAADGLPGPLLLAGDAARRVTGLADDARIVEAALAVDAGVLAALSATARCHAAGHRAMITPLSVAHAALMAGMHRICFAEPWDQAAMAGLLASPGCGGFLEGTGDEPRGFILVRTAADEAEILTLLVLPPYRRAGIARALMEAAGALARAGGATVLYLEVAAGNAAARSLYAGLDFVEAGRRPRYYPGGGDALILRRTL